MSLREQLQSHVAGRSELTVEALCGEFGVPVAEASHLGQALRVLEEEYGVPMGLLRGADPIEIFTEPPRTKNPFSWLFNRAEAEDKTAELGYQIRRQRRRIGAPPLASGPVIRTVRDYVIAWIGQTPER
ncbi:MAG: hypothetical protein RRA92_08080 [Gemmatimonadota bacterium]|nr:hypothetical protein [Gemmatimonadota bacterium]